MPSGRLWIVLPRGPSGFRVGSVPAGAASSAAPPPAFAYCSTSSTPPSVWADPLPGEALFLVSSLRASNRIPRATRAWQAGLQAGSVLRGDAAPVEPTPVLVVRSLFP